ncbi:putative serine/threonine protein kinase [Paratrimastix pyriformis]|uniref:Serine/threonine protein kinase n=1 Tax=Paratrimastix pyriformis TaxID=342808 RepID=A0ABQ8UU69_9EUKA|nr:putative serine/threonine protein kinase [Paratrimastix pyriformis]
MPHSLPGYMLGRFLGKGASGEVYLGRRVCDGKRCAIKKIHLDIIDPSPNPRDPLSLETLDPTHKREIYVMRAAGAHQNIVTLYDSYVISDFLFLVEEYCANGELFDYVGAGMEQAYARHFFRQAVDGLSHAHARQVAHRDLKLENILLSETLTLKLCDFGLARIFNKGTTLTTICGTPQYVAPEMLTSAGYDGAKADIWSLGVVLMAVLTAAMPVYERASDGDVFYDLLKAHSYAYEPWTTVLADPSYALAADLLRRMLEADPAQRISLQEVARHPWVASSGEPALSPAEIRAYMAQQRAMAGLPRLLLCLLPTTARPRISHPHSFTFFRCSVVPPDAWVAVEAPAAIPDAATHADDVVYRGEAGEPPLLDEDPLPTTTIRFGLGRGTSSAGEILGRLRQAMEAAGLTVTDDPENRLVLMGMQQDGSGLHVELFRDKEDVPLAVFARVGLKTEFLRLWQEVSQAFLPKPDE